MRKTECQKPPSHFLRRHGSRLFIRLALTALLALLALQAPAADHTWTGLGDTNDWSEPANWSGNLVPGPSDRAIFNATSSKDAVIDTDFSIQAMDIQAGYTGSIIQGASALTLVSGLYSQAGGHFVGGSGPINFATTFILSGGIFTASSGTTAFGFSFNRTGGVWNANGGTVAFVSNFDFNISAPPAIEFNNVEVSLGNNLTRMQPTFDTTVVVNGDLNFISGQLSGSGIVEARGEVVIPATHTSIEGGNLRFAGNTVRTITIPSGAQLCNLEINAPNTTITTSGNGLVTLGSVQLIDVVEFTNAAADLDVRPGRNWTQSGGTFTAGSGSLMFGNFFTLSGGTFTGSSSPISIPINTFTLSGGIFTASSGTTAFGYIFNQTGGVWNANGGTVAFVSNFDFNISAPPAIEFNNVEVSLGNNLTRMQPTFDTTVVVNGDLNFISGQLSGSGIVEARGEVVIPATHTSIEGGNLRFAGNTVRTITIPSGAQLCNLEINAPNTTITTSGNGLVTLGSVQLIDVVEFTNAAADLDVRPGRNWTQSGGTFTAGSGSLMFGNFFTLSGGTFTGSSSPISIPINTFTLSGGIFTASSGTTAFGYIFNQTGGTWNANGGTVLFVGNFGSSINAPTGTVFNHLVMDKDSSSIQLQFASDVVAQGQVSLLRGGPFGQVGGELQLHGDLLVGEGVGLGTGPLIRFSGTTDQSFINLGSFNPAGTWVIDKPAGDLVLQSDLDLSHAIGFFQPLELINGKIVTGEFTIFAGPRLITRTNGYVVGNLQRQIDSTGNRLFPLGTDSGYAPVNVNVTTLGQNPSELRVGLIDTPHPRLDPGSSLAAYWQLTEFGDITADVTLNYLQDDVVGDETAYRLLGISEDTLNVFVPPQVTINTTTNVVVANGISEFTDWALAEPAQPVSIAPAAPTVPPESVIEFSALAGYPPFVFELTDNNSGASFDPQTRLYTAGAVLGAVDVVRVTDSFGFVADSAITVDVIPTRVVITVQPGDLVAGETFTPAIRVELQDEDGRLAELSTAAISLAIADNPGGGSLSGTSTRNAVAGVALFDDLSIEQAADGYTLAASSDDLDEDLSIAFSITPAAAARLAFTVQPTDTLPQQAITPAVEIRIEDDFGNLVTDADDAVSISLGANPGGSVLSGTLIRPADSGLATFDDLSLDQIGRGYTLAASASGLSSAESAAFDIISPFMVTNTNDSGVGSLRFAIEAANATPGHETISFNIPGPGPHEILVESKLPFISRPITIDATTQPGYLERPIVGIKAGFTGDPNSTGFDLVGQADGSEIAGLAISGFGIGIRDGRINNRIRANHIGLDLAGNFVAPVKTIGVSLIGRGAVVGGPTPADRNVISGNLIGIAIRTEFNRHGNVVEGNYIGLDHTGMVPITASPASGQYGIQSLGNGLQPDETEKRNLIRNNVIAGQQIALATILDADIINNLIGLNANGEPVYESVQGGILTTAGASSGTLISENRIFVVTGSSGFRGININRSLSPRPNQSQSALNYPQIFQARASGGNLAINGAISTAPDHHYRIEFFASPECSVTGHGPGVEFLGSTEIAVGSSGAVSFTVNFPINLPGGSVVTATSTELQTLITSEFSRCTVVAPAYFDVSGRVTDNLGAPIVNAMVHSRILPAGGLARSVRTDSSGFYQFSDSFPFQSTSTSVFVRPIFPVVYDYSPTSREYINVSADQEDQDYLGTPALTISGVSRVTLGGSDYALGGVAFSVSGPETRVLESDVNGYFEARQLPPGVYTVTPQHDGYTFQPSSIMVQAEATPTLLDFLATPLNANEGRIAVRSGKSLTLMNADGSARVEIADLGTGSDVAFSRDGSMLAWTEQVCTSDTRCRSRIFIANFDGSGKRMLTPDISSTAANQRFPAWSPDGSQVSYIFGQVAIVIANVQTGSAVNSIPSIGVGELDNAYELRWAPSGNQLIYTLRRAGDTVASELATISALGGTPNIYAAAPFLARHARAVFSPDGSSVLFGRRSLFDNAFGLAAGVSGAGNSSVHRVNAIGTGLVTLPMPTNPHDQYAWSPDGQSIGLTAETEVFGRIQNLLRIYDTSGNQRHAFRVPTGRLSWGPSYSPVTPPGVSVQVQAGAARITYSGVSAVGETSVVPIPPGSAGDVPNGFVVGSYGAWEISTTAVVEPPIIVCFVIDSFDGSSTKFASLAVLHNENGNLVDRTVSRDFATRTICALVDSFSPFVVAEEIDPDLPLITGLVLNEDEQPMAGVSVILNGSESRITVSDSNGLFTFPNLEIDGNYNVQPRLTGHLFTEYSQDFIEMQGSEAVVFIGVEAEFSITGQVVDEALVGIEGIQVVLEGDAFDITVTDENGQFIFEGLPADGSFLIQAEGEGLEFIPADLLIEPLVGDVEGLDILAVPLAPPLSDAVFQDRFQVGGTSNSFRRR
jgi:hypothetical protein